MLMKKTRATKLVLRCEIERVGEAQSILDEPGQAVLVNRGYLRSIVFACPDGCGELLTINLDPKAGKAWRLYKTKHGITLFPSVWRDNGCESHFVVWSDKIIWFGSDGDYSQSSIYASNVELESKITNVLSHGLRSYLDIADEIDEIPWDVLYSCTNLVTKNRAKRGSGNERDFFRLS
jgi:hypothetical protein